MAYIGQSIMLRAHATRACMESRIYTYSTFGFLLVCIAQVLRFFYSYLTQQNNITQQATAPGC